MDDIRKLIHSNASSEATGGDTVPAEHDPRVPGKAQVDAAATWLWVRDDPTFFVRTPEFVAIIDGLLMMLQDHYVPQQEAYAAVRRTARILAALVAEAERRPRPGERQPRWVTPRNLQRPLCRSLHRAGTAD